MVYIMIDFVLVCVPVVLCTFLLREIVKCTFSKIKLILIYILNILVLYGITCTLYMKIFHVSDIPIVSSYAMKSSDIWKYIMVLAVVFFITLLLEIWFQRNSYLRVEEYSIPKKPSTYIMSILTIILIFLGFTVFWAVKWYIDVYGDVGIDAMLFTLFTNKKGTQTDIIMSYVRRGLVPTLISGIIVSCVALLKTKKRIELRVRDKYTVGLYPFTKIESIFFSLVLVLVLFSYSGNKVGFIQYVKYALTQSTIYEDEYVNPSETVIAFPEKKQNLIIIFMESMETTFFSKEYGGALNHNAIPELYELADANINFSQNEGVGGAYAMTGATWTIGALVAYNTGIPLKLPSTVNKNAYTSDSFLSGATTMIDILHNAGYYQAFMVGSDMEFGGRKQFYLEHNVDRTYDIYDAYNDGIVPDGYWIWWGMEDYHLYDYAKQELLEIAGRDEPFAFTMLTVDTHQIGGYKCKLCGDEYEEKYDNVYACASRQLNEFILWCQEQDFYEDTTIVILGDHPSMDSEYIERNINQQYVRRTYNCIINARVDSEYTKNRQFCTMDMFPTILGAIGCEIEGNRLGLGTNLFSGEKTLIEKMGYDALDIELQKASKYYKHNFY